MKFHLFFAILALVIGVIAQGVTEQIAPKGDAPDGSKPSVDGAFEITVSKLNTKAKKRLALETRTSCTSTSNLVATLSGGVLTDAHNRTGYIASNYQLQFDAPPQAGALYTAGFSALANGSLALGPSAVFYQCASGAFWNLYDRDWAEQCEAVAVVVLPCDNAQEEGVGEGETVAVVGSEVVTTTVVVPLGDGQPQVVTTTVAVPVCQIGDGQVQGHTTPCSAAVGTPPPASEYSDGQVQVTPGPRPSGSLPPPVSEYSDGQVQVTPGPEPTASVPEAQETTASGPAVVPTGGSPENGAGSARGWVGGAAVVVGLGVGGVVWF